MRNTGREQAFWAPLGGQTAGWHGTVPGVRLQETGRNHPQPATPRAWSTGVPTGASRVRGGSRPRAEPWHRHHRTHERNLMNKAELVSAIAKRADVPAST